MEVEVEEGGVGVSVGWPDGPRRLGSPGITHPLSRSAAAAQGVHPSHAPQEVKAGDSIVT
ncbi:unnamed protein product, partial [Pleuronectes platessa]